MEKWFRCDSCGKLFPKSGMKEVQYEHTDHQKAKEKLATLVKHGMVCEECSQPKAVTTKDSGKGTTTTKASSPTTTKR